MGAALHMMLIEALGYLQQKDDFDAGNEHHFRSLVRWLENTYVKLIRRRRMR